jgi:uncharacterized protein with FMN-binding domain
MRRAILVAAGTVVGLVALLDYKSSGGIGPGNSAVGGGVPVSAGTSSPPTSPASSPSSPASTAPSSEASSPPSTRAPVSSPSSRGPATYTGADVTYLYGTIGVSITVADERITAITTPVQSADDPHSADINAQAVPILTKEALAAQGVHFDVVSGATYTSNAFAQSLESAIGKEAK